MGRGEAHQKRRDALHFAPSAEAEQVACGRLKQCCRYTDQAPAVTCSECRRSSAHRKALGTVVLAALSGRASA